MITALLFVVAITAIVWFLNRLLPFKICPICVGVSLTWIGLTAGLLSGNLASSNYMIPIAMLMGATVVGIAYQGEKALGMSGNTLWRWKVPVIVGGLGIAYWLFISMSWTTLVIELVILLGLTIMFFVLPGRTSLQGKENTDRDPDRMKKLVDDMESCC